LASNRAAKAAAAAPYAAGGVGVVFLALGAIWAVSQVKGPIGDIIGGAKKAVEAPPDFFGGVFGEERVRKEIPLAGFLDLGRFEPKSGAAYWPGPYREYDPDIPTSYSIEGGEIVVINPNPGIPLARAFEVDIPSAPRRSGTAVRGRIGEAIDPSEYYTPFEGQVPFGGPKFDIRPWKW